MTDTLQTAKWWDEPKGEAHDALFAYVQRLAKRQVTERDRLWDFYRLFDAKACAAARGRPNDVPDGPRLALNVVRSTVNTVHARIAQSTPRPTYLTLRQGAGGRRRAKATQAFSDGCLYHADGANVAGEIGQAAAIFGTGIGKIYCGADGRPALDSVFPRDILVAKADGKRRKPRTVYHYRAESRDELMGQYAGDAEALALIADAPCAGPDMRADDSEDNDEVVVCEAHRRPWSMGEDGTNDGRHVIALENGTLADEPWKRDPPYVFLRWGLRPTGMWGYGIAEQLMDLQFEINMLLMRIQEQMRYAGPKVFVERGSSIVADDISNEIMGIIEYVGTKPEFMTFATVHPEMFQQLDRLVQRAFDEVGISEFAARSEKPAGLNSGKALRTFSDLETAKFAYFGKGYERLFRDISTQMLALVMDMGDDGDLSVTLPVKRYRTQYLEKVNRKDIITAKDDFVCQVFPTSALAQAPAQKLEQVGEMMDRQILTKEEYLQLLDFPDLENATSLASAPLDYVDFCIDRILEEGEVLRPEPWVRPELAIPRCTDALVRAQADQMPEERWELLADYIEALVAKQDQEKAAAAAAAGPPPGAPPMDAGAPPPDAGMAPALPPGGM